MSSQFNGPFDSYFNQIASGVGTHIRVVNTPVINLLHIFFTVKINSSVRGVVSISCLLYTSDAADEWLTV